MSTKQETFDWIPFYEEVALALLPYRARQDELIGLLKSIADSELPMIKLEDRDDALDPVALRAIDPFTFFASFNRRISEENRIEILRRIKTGLNIKAPVPATFTGLPVLDNRNSWFFSFEHKRSHNDIERLWTLFELALQPNPFNSEKFKTVFEDCAAQPGLRFKITIGLFWVSPNQFLALDGKNRQYLKIKFGNDPVTLDGYLRVLEELRKSHPKQTYPEVSTQAWKQGGALPNEADGKMRTSPFAAKASYSRESARADGLFLTDKVIELTLARLREKQNLILQGAPGVGKTFFAKRLAYMHLQERADNRIAWVQFHPSYSYEDFVRGYRPSAVDQGNRFELKDGAFLRLCEAAAADENNDYVMVIDEINRANIGQVFGELFSMLETDKRGKQITLMYSKSGEEFTVPPNVFIIGTMNTADRSLALVDFALRRRFSFVELEPCFDMPAFTDFLGTGGMDERLIGQICQRMLEVNALISNDKQLGPSYRIGHSFFCPHRPDGDFSDCDQQWYENIVSSELLPLLSEYWFDNEAMLNRAKQVLLA